MSDLIEILADVEHQRWSNWMKHLFSKCEPNGDGTAIIPAFFVERWDRKANTSYDELTEAEKESDRREVRVTLKAMTDFAVKNI